MGLDNLRISNGNWWHSEESLKDFTHSYFPRNIAYQDDLGFKWNSCRFSGGRTVELPVLKLHVGAMFFQPQATIYLGLANGNDVNTGRFQFEKRQSISYLRNYKYVANSSIALQRNSQNFHHFLVETLPSLLAYKSSGYAFKQDLWVGESQSSAFLIAKLGINSRVRVMKPFSLSLIHESDILSLLPAGHLNADLLREVVDRVIGPASQFETNGSVIWLGRSDRDVRQLSNEKEVIETIRRKFPKLQVIIPGDLAIEDQVTVLSKARIIFSPHGAQATNLIWAKKLESFIEISVTEELIDYKSICKVLGIEYHRVVSIGDKTYNGANHACNLESLNNALLTI
jgi:capsular polysaccharide biosynthesis protein